MRSITAKVALISSTCVVAVAALLIWDGARQASELAGKAARNQVRTRAREQASNARAELRRALDVARSLAQVLSGTKDDEVMLDIGRDEMNGILQIVLAQNPRISGVFTCWESGQPDGLDDIYKGESGSDAVGRYMPFWYRVGTRERVAVLSDRDPDFLETYYPEVRMSMQDLVTPPRALPARGDTSWSATVTAPIVAGERFYGVVGLEIDLGFLQELCERVEKDEILTFFGPNSQVLASSGFSGEEGAATRDGSPRPYERGGVRLSDDGYFVAHESIELVSLADPWGLAVKLPAGRIAQTTRGVVWGQLWRSFLVVAAALAASQLLSWRMTKNIVEVTHSLKEISEGTGDLTQRLDVRSADEVGRLAVSFNTFVEKVQSIVQEVSASAEEVATSASQIAASSQELASAIVQLGGQVSEVSAQASDAASVAERGRGVVQETITRMDSIHRMISRAAESIDQLGDQSQQITNVVRVISGFTQQTDLLALNAGVEAARAGDAGRGFRVVAEEIKDLANQTSQSAVEIGETIDTIYARTQDAVTNMSGGTDALEEGCAKAKEAYESLESIVENALKVLGRVQHITQITLQLRGGVEQSASAASGLSSRADALRQIVSSFKLYEESR